MKKIVYVVHCIDTEGPMYESLEENFLRLSNIFGVVLSPTQENLLKLQHQEINLGGNEKAIANLLAPQRLNMNKTWNEIDLMLDEIQSEEYRKVLPDGQGEGWKYSWFCLDHVGFVGNNPRRRDIGHHNIFDHYRRRLVNYPQDIIQWHYHPLPVTGNCNDSGTAYLNSANIWEIISRKVIERQWFPSAFRPGFHTERPDSNWFLEQWIPFDYGNQAVTLETLDQPDLSDGRYGDWRIAPREWKPYHPDHKDYQRKGSCSRWITRCLNMEARLRELTIDDVRDAFFEARNNGKSLLAFTNHDFRDMRPEIDKVRQMIQKASREFSDVEFVYSDAVDAMRKMTGLKIEKSDLEHSLIIRNSENAKLIVTSKRSIFGPQPYLAIKLKGNRFIWENFDFQGVNAWSFTFDNNHIPFHYVEKISVATNSPSGVAEVSVVYDFNGK